MSYCPNCGKENTAGGKFCIHCGTRLPVPPGSDDSRQRSASGNGSSAVTGSGGRSGAGREEVIYTSAVRRNIAVCVILSILTLGIYYLIWMCRLNSDINEMSQDSSALKRDTFSSSDGVIAALNIPTRSISKKNTSPHIIIEWTGREKTYIGQD